MTTTEITGTVTATEDDARATRDDLPGSLAFQAYVIRSDDGTEQTVLVIAGSPADVAFGKDLPLRAQVGQRVTCVASEGPYGLVAQERATGERDADGRKIRVTFTVEG